tara:strand:- start:20017 stop:21258 length:1242 start_codon:yes stop_codon:yes gene_type:complete
MTIGTPVIELILLIRVWLGKEDPTRVNERRGKAQVARPPGELIWLHAASVGESIAALVLIQKLTKMKSSMTILLTTGTLTSAKLLTARLPKSVIHQFAPLDRSAWVQTFLNHWSPDLVLIMESEFWPTQIQQINNRNIPIIIVNARLSKRSYSRWQWTKKMSRSIFENLDLVIATNPEQAQRFINLGAPNVEVGGNLKRSAAKLSLNKKSVAEISKQVGGRKIWLAASTHEGEDLTVIRTQRLLQHQFPDLLTIIVPRHPKRGPSIQRLGEANGLCVSRRASNEEITLETNLYVADTLGEMSIFFDIAPFVFVAGSLVPVGGHNPIEPAHFNCSIFFGPLMAKNQEIADEMIRSKAALQMDTNGSLAKLLEDLFNDDELATMLSNNAKEYAESGNAILESVFDSITPFIKSLR